LTTWIPSDNKDHLVKYDRDILKGTVIKGKKSLNQLIRENLDSNKELTDIQRDSLKTRYRVKLL